MAGERILIVDDEESIRGLLARVCLQAGYEVITAGDAASVNTALEEGRPDLCIVDLRLPDTDGIQILKRAKELHPDCEVIILTGYGELNTAIAALRLGAYDYLQKPVNDLQLILLSASRALERQRLGRHNARLLYDLQTANAELELRRQQQLGHINDLGRALAGALQSRDVAQVLVSAMLNQINCDAAGVLLVTGHDPASAWALLGSRKSLAPQARQKLVAAMLARLPAPSRPTLKAVHIEELQSPATEEADNAPWRACQFSSLAGRDGVEGVAALASHAEEPFSAEALGFFEIFATQGSVALANAQLFTRTQELATRDGLTGLCNHRHFFELLEAEISRCERYNLELSVIMFDVDRGAGTGLKAVNDAYGHQAGDELLRALAELLRRNVRLSDVVARYGGDEFIILAPQTGRDAAYPLALRIGEQLRSQPLIAAGHEVRLTVSVGVTVFRPGQSDTASSVVSRADRGLYTSKEKGGDCVCLVDRDVKGGKAPAPVL